MVVCCIGDLLHLLAAPCCPAGFLACPNPAPPTLQFVTDAWGDFIVLGEGSTCVVYLGRLQGFEVALKVRMRCWGGQGLGMDCTGSPEALP